jgi:hypothetical protein
MGGTGRLIKDSGSFPAHRAQIEVALKMIGNPKSRGLLSPGKLIEPSRIEFGWPSFIEEAAN